MYARFIVQGFFQSFGKWGQGESLHESERAYRKAGGRSSKIFARWAFLAFDPFLDPSAAKEHGKPDAYVDGYGSVNWTRCTRFKLASDGAWWERWEPEDTLDETSRLDYSRLQRAVQSAMAVAQYRPGRYGGLYVARQFERDRRRDSYLILCDDDPESSVAKNPKLDILAQVTPKAVHPFGRARNWINADGTINPLG